MKKIRSQTKYYLFVLLLLAIVLIASCAPQKTETIEKKIKAPTALSEEIKTLPDGTRYIVHPGELQAGGPPKDGIPSIDNPKFESSQEADKWLNPEDLILGINFNDVIKAYPIGIMNWHEIVNDKLNNMPIAVTYCPLCRSGIAFIRTIDGQEVEFGTSGKLYNSDLVMYDRLTDSYWSQILGKAIIGELSGYQLEAVPTDTVRWKDWKANHPDTLVLSKDTGFIRSYDYNPYSGYQQDQTAVWPTVKFIDTRLGPKEIVQGVVFGDTAKAYHEETIKKVGVLNDEVSGALLLILWDPNLNVLKIFKRAIDNETLTFELKDSKLVDSKGNEWNFDGESGGKKLERIGTVSGHFWLAWVAFYPNTELYK